MEGVTASAEPFVSSVAEVLVKESVVNETRPGFLLEGVSTFVQTLLNRGFLDSQLPTVATRIYFLNWYAGAVQNGGHKGFLFNAGGWRPPLMNSIADGLDALGDPECCSILSDLAAFHRDQPRKFAREMIGYHHMEETPDPFIETLDRRFFTGGKIALIRERIDLWLRDLDLEAVPDAAFDLRMEALKPDPVAQKARRTQALRMLTGADENDPVFLAMELVVAAGGQRNGLLGRGAAPTLLRWESLDCVDRLAGLAGFLSWKFDLPALTDDVDAGRRDVEVSAMIDTTEGSGWITFTRNAARLTINKERRADVSMAQVERQVRKMTGKSVRAALGLDPKGL